MIKIILVSILEALLTSFLATFGFFYLFSQGSILAYSQRIEAILKLNSFWLAFGVWAFLFLLFFYLPISLLFYNKKSES